MAAAIDLGLGPVGNYFKVIEKLSAQFPEQKSKDIRQRALTITSER